MSVGQYLAGDQGTTFEVGKTFDNGTRVAAFATLTDVSAEEFGEGSFDKGVSVTMPIDLFTRKPSNKRRSAFYRPISGDGGAKLARPERLWEKIRYNKDWAISRTW